MLSCCLRSCTVCCPVLANADTPSEPLRPSCSSAAAHAPDKHAASQERSCGRPPPHNRGLPVQSKGAWFSEETSGLSWLSCYVASQRRPAPRSLQGPCARCSLLRRTQTALCQRPPPSASATACQPCLPAQQPTLSWSSAASAESTHRVRLAAKVTGTPCTWTCPRCSTP